MNDKPKVYIAGIGMITPLGANAEMTAAFVRCGRSAYRECNFFDEDFNNIKMATVPDEALEDSLDEESLTGPMPARHARMLQMAKLAMLDLMPKLPPDEKLPLFLAGPEPLAANDQAFNMTFIHNLALQTGANLDLAQCRINSMGRAGGLNSIKLAFRFFESTNAKWALVGGVDSFYDKEVLNRLVSERRLLCGEITDGFIPGEAAAFLLVTKASINVTGLPCIYEPGSGTENGHLYNEKTYTGDGLANAVTMALANSAPSKKVQTIFTGMNGEHHWAKEYGVAMIRNRDAFDENAQHEHPADCYGDLGSASGIVMLGMIAHYLRTGKATAPCLVCCSSDHEYRGAVVIDIGGA